MKHISISALAEIDFPDTPFNLLHSLTLLGRRGSEAHGTYVPPTDPDAIDDRDLMGICVPPALWSLGIRKHDGRPWEGADAIKGVWDVVLYDYRKFVGLLCKQNPSVLSMLWLEEEDYLFIDGAGQALLDARLLFRDRRAAAASFIGYAEGQLKKMESGNVYQGYMGAKRKALVDRFGFDCKNAAHAVRLLHMGIEYLRTGFLKVRRVEDRDMLIEIKTGKWAKERVLSYARDQLAVLRHAETVSDLPESIDQEAVEELLMTRYVPRILSAPVGWGG